MSGTGFWRAGCIGLGLAFSFLLGLTLAGGSPARAEGGGVSAPQGGGGGGGATADGDRNMIAVTGTSPTGSAVLYLVDTKQKRLVVYQGTGKNIELVAARNIEYDLKLDAYRDESPSEVQVPVLRERYLKAQGGGKAGNEPDAEGSKK
jgi:hypothetical protein